MDRAAIVVDLGFGDAGKGLVTDWLVRTLGAGLVARFHGGAQAGHNVVTPDGRHHTFAQIGAGTFVPGVRTYLGRDVVIHPTALLLEAAHLASVGVPDALARLHVSDEALVISPFQQAAGRLRELARGDGRHGSCGVGVGETVGDALASPGEAIRAGSLRGARGPQRTSTRATSTSTSTSMDDSHALRRALLRLQERKREELRHELRALQGSEAAAGERWILEDPGIVDRFLEAIAPVRGEVSIVGTDWLQQALAAPGAVVLEGAQGVLLDEWAGFHPHTTWSTCTFQRGLELLREGSFGGAVSRIGVLRTYGVRHGQGPLPTEDETLDPLLPERHNIEGPWQGRVRRGWPDLLLARYALEVCGGADALAITHLDALGRVLEWRGATAYEAGGAPESLFDKASGDPGKIKRIRPPTGQDLDRQTALGAALSAATPVYEPLPWTGERGCDNAMSFFEERLGVPVRIASSGPTATDVRARGALFRDVV